MGRDADAAGVHKGPLISIHAPHMGRDVIVCGWPLHFSIFQSTRPIWGATDCGPPHRYQAHYFNPRAPYGARREEQISYDPEISISIHAPHMGRDAHFVFHWRGGGLFQSTRPIWGATRAGLCCLILLLDFNPRAPYGARPRAQRWHGGWIGHFNPRAPYGARRGALGQRSDGPGISIHAPHMGRDSAKWQWTLWRSNFNPRAPYGARRSPTRQSAENNISIHAPHMGRDCMYQKKGGTVRYFNPRAPYGARQQKCIKCIIYVLHFCNNRQPKHKSQQETSSVRTFF